MLFLFYLLLVCIVSFFRLGIILSRILTLLIVKNAQTRSAKKLQVDVLYWCILFCFQLIIHFIFRPHIVKK